MTNKHNIQVKCTPDLKELLYHTARLANFTTMSAFIRHSIITEADRTLKRLSLNSEINGLINLAQKLEARENKKHG